MKTFKEIYNKITIIELEEGIGIDIAKDIAKNLIPANVLKLMKD